MVNCPQGRGQSKSELINFMNGRPHLQEVWPGPSWRQFWGNELAVECLMVGLLGLGQTSLHYIGPQLMGRNESLNHVTCRSEGWGLGMLLSGSIIRFFWPLLHIP